MNTIWVGGKVQESPNNWHNIIPNIDIMILIALRVSVTFSNTSEFKV